MDVGNEPVAHVEIDDRALVKAMSLVGRVHDPRWPIRASCWRPSGLGPSARSARLGATIVWTVSVLLGALQNNIYAEMATMFPEKSGGIALFAHEGWRRYCAAGRPGGHLRLLVRLVDGSCRSADWIAGTLLQAEVLLLGHPLPTGAGRTSMIDSRR